MSNELRAARKLSGKTQAQVAEEAMVTEAAYQRYEYGKREPRVRTAIRIARTLGSSVEQLFGAATPEEHRACEENPHPKDTTSAGKQASKTDDGTGPMAAHPSIP